MAWRKDKPVLINTNHIKAWLDFEVIKRIEAMKKDLSDECPYGKPDDVHRIPNITGTGTRARLFVEPYESFYMTQEQYKVDIRYLRIIYEYFKLSDIRIEHAWKWGKYLWVKQFAKKNPTKTYKEVCGFARNTEMIIRTLLYDYSDDIKRFGEREFAN